MAQYKSQSYSQVNLNFRVTGEHARLVHSAAALHQESAAAFMRRVILEWSAAEMKLPAPDLSEYAGDIIAHAAKQLGISPKEFTERAARESAARVLHNVNGKSVQTIEEVSAELRSKLAQSGPPPGESGQRKAVEGRRR